MQRPLALVALLSIAFHSGCAVFSAERSLRREIGRDAGREILPPEPRQIVTPLGTLERVRGVPVAEVEADAGAAAVVLDIGTGSPVTCLLYDVRLDLGGVIAQLSRIQLEQLAGSAEAIELQAIGEIDSGATPEGHPYLSLEWLYRVDGTGRALKQRIGANGERSLYCAHPEIGYRKTFEHFFAAALASIEYDRSSEAAPYFREISLIGVDSKQGRMQLGFESIELRRDSEGDISSLRRTSILWPDDDELVVASDDTMVAWSRSDGSLINATATRRASTGGLIQLQVRPAGGGRWTVAGAIDGEPVEASFRSPGPLLSPLGLNMVLTDIQYGDRPVRLDLWTPNPNPFVAREFVVSATGPEGEAGLPVSVRSDDIAVSGIADEHSLRRATVTSNDGSLSVRRVFVEGRR